MAAATKTPANAIAAQTQPDSPDDDAVAATDVLVVVGVGSAVVSGDVAVAKSSEGSAVTEPAGTEPAGEPAGTEPAGIESTVAEPAGSELTTVSAPPTAPSASSNLISPSTG